MQYVSIKTQKRQRVSFSNETVHIWSVAESEKYDTPSEKLWYTKSELSYIKREVGKVLIRNTIETARQQTKDVYDDPQTKDVYDDPELWGLERHGLERHHAKKTAIKLILIAQSMKENSSDPEFLRNVSLHCSKKAQGLARDQGFRDSCHVFYEDSLEQLVDDCIFDCSIPSRLCGCKRSTSAASFALLVAEDHERRVRSRLSAA
jgi:hypothetical protein